MQNVSKTMYIPLYGKAYVSKKGIILSDSTAERIWQEEHFPLRGKAKSKWLAYSMSMRAAVFDGWVREQLKERYNPMVLHIGCGMDSRVYRLEEDRRRIPWYDIDLPEVIAERRKYYTEDDYYHMLEGNALYPSWIFEDGSYDTAIVVMEGLSMYLPYENLVNLLTYLRHSFPRVVLLMDCYTPFGAKASRYKNPINTVGVTETYGIEDPVKLAEDAEYTFVTQHDMAPKKLIRQLKGFEQTVFRKVFAGKFANDIYRMYSFEA